MASANAHFKSQSADIPCVATQRLPNNNGYNLGEARTLRLCGAFTGTTMPRAKRRSVCVAFMLSLHHFSVVCKVPVDVRIGLMAATRS